MTPKKINELIACKLFGIKKVYYPDWMEGTAYGGEWPFYIPSGKPWRTHSIDVKPLPRFTENIAAAFQAVDKLISFGYADFCLTHVVCVDAFFWVAEINGPWKKNLGKPFYSGTETTRIKAICSMIVEILDKGDKTP
ncbi:MAG: hypothetical protein ACYDHZ_00310 [Dehalococcoidia bacterium]